MSRQSQYTTESSHGELEGQYAYDGQGTVDDPFVVGFRKNDDSNPMNWGNVRKWWITTIVTLSVFVVTFTSSAYAGSAGEIISDFQISTEVYIVGISLFVLGFAVGPVVWAPLVS